jgi:hypothetical protein
MALTHKLFVSIKAAVILLMTLYFSDNNYLLYLNNPETVKTSGILHQKKYISNSKVRYFVHYKNGTDKNQKFYIKSDKKIKNLKKSFSTNQRPEYAGAQAVKNFFTNPVIYNVLNISSVLEPEETISGIFEGEIEKGTNVICKIGNENNKIDSLDVYQLDYDINKSFSLNLQQKNSFKIGEIIDGKVDGQYGSNINVQVKPNENGVLKLSFSPRGGDGILVFMHRGIIHTTKLLPAKKTYEVISVYVEKNKTETFTFIPLGGLNYPIRLDFRLSNYFTENMA